ncbi:hypothetical protein [Roseisalinus antarcticus]|uniref:Lipoprotein n=1 Tax=Roseisalinus antarcticus TaxID=254357 RepID=A0A1Y5RXK2_9RHOB|nr:hypothetical protein [Roseisalinus antarcticus]SLN27852.1 hypothetical protein ROA7023_00910 [Roseisalinus antarcticus]
MRNTIFTSLAVLALAAGGAAQAQDRPEGCYARAYSAEHLAAHPDQVVAGITVGFYFDEPHDDFYTEVIAQMANQGHAAKDGFGGRELSQIATCFQDNDGWYCSVDCDGGVIHIDGFDDESLQVHTSGFTIGPADGCGGTTTLAEIPGEATTYRLFRAAPEICESNEQTE